MIAKNGQELYTFKELTQILSVGRERLTKAMDQHVLIPTDIEKFRGKAGFRYLFSKDEVIRYAEKIGLNPIWENIYDEEGVVHEKKVMDARREIRKVIDPQPVQDGTLITADNVERVFAQIQAQKEPMHVAQKEQKFEPLDYYVIKLGNGYVNEVENNTVFINLNMSPACVLDRERAITLQGMYGGQILQLGFKEFTA